MRQRLRLAAALFSRACLFTNSLIARNQLDRMLLKDFTRFTALCFSTIAALDYRKHVF